MIPEISASKVAALIGLNKFQSVSETMYDLFQKDKDVKAKVAEIERANGRCSFNVVVNNILKEQCIQDCISMGVAEVMKTEDVKTVLETVEQKANLILKLRHSSLDQSVRNRVAGEVRGMVSKRRGIRNENNILNQYEVDREVKVVERNTKMCKKTYSNFKLVGRTDGYVASENRIVDSKDRTRFWDTVPIYDEVQLRCYMDMTGAAESELVERFPDGKTRHTKFINDPEKWKFIEEATAEAVTKMNEILENPDQLKRIVFENTICNPKDGSSTI